MATKLQKYYMIFVYILQGKMGKTEKTRKVNHTTKVTKLPKPKRQKYGMNKTYLKGRVKVSIWEENSFFVNSGNC